MGSWTDRFWVNTARVTNGGGSSFVIDPLKMSESLTADIALVAGDQTFSSKFRSVNIR
jgi:hypothetical protein